MGCGTSSSKKVAMGKTEKTIKAAILIQRWYRKTNARLEARRRATWSIFQSIEYSGEQDQFKLYNFFNTMVEQFSSDGQQSAILKALREGDDKKHITGIDRDRETDIVKLVADASRMSIPPAYDGPVLKFPITQSQVKALMQAFKSDKVIHPKYLLELLHHSRVHLMKLPNIHRVSTATAKQVTVCGDIHGQLNDLFIILHKNGLPSHENPYIFNGDFVDRGPHSVEVFTLLLVFMLDSFSKVYLNRGNHEDHSMNVRYGFTKEVMRKYKDSAAKLIKMYNEVFSYLPLATVIDQSVLVVHGGISEHVDLNLIDKIDRKKVRGLRCALDILGILCILGILDILSIDPCFGSALDPISMQFFISVLRPPSYDEALGKPKLPLKMKDLEEWQQVSALISWGALIPSDHSLLQIVDLLWSDPRQANGMVFNTFRGGGCYFGPDITEKVLNRHSLKMLIRSHQCKEEGFEYTHNNKVLTVFSASNYYEEDSNKGAYVKVLRPKPGTIEMPHYYKFNNNSIYLSLLPPSLSLPPSISPSSLSLSLSPSLSLSYSPSLYILFLTLSLTWQVSYPMPSGLQQWKVSWALMFLGDSSNPSW
ncbi:unnamed protein product [Lymnaea stagnalis]|uniref:Serine/threonine-protein phosphatase n=1 Tax=Lymnaea stagnalis TaxID=6523 RepID=A0AAV2I667_LYMST